MFSIKILLLCSLLTMTKQFNRTHNSSRLSRISKDRIREKFLQYNFEFPYKLLNAVISSPLEAMKRWPGKTIPYELSPSLPKTYVETIKEVIKDFHIQTCLNFRKKSSNDLNYVYFEYLQKSSQYGGPSQKGFTPGKTVIELSELFKDKISIMRCILFILGFWIENSRPDRDEYVKINYENMQKGAEKYFGKYNESEINTFGLQYDFNSIMHYSPTVFSKNNLPTIQSKIEGKVIKHGDTFSKGDLMKISLLYCHNTPKFHKDDTMDAEKREEEFCPTKSRVLPIAVSLALLAVVILDLCLKIFVY